MKTIELSKLEAIQGGDFVDGFCAGFAVVAGGYAVGVAANLWNPVGWVGTAVGGVIGVGCAVNTIANAM
ncbi:hypothetical protein ACFQ1M_15600 [Sungkyunkwania multivorans]|uniref:Class IIb bacteriocin, lactobin A/cerein 7B family n=1 Tax=Sungkyunkwania multivorans TaxID=1173618 RepID=A0ABW3D3R5_9FLAO